MFIITNAIGLVPDMLARVKTGVSVRLVARLCRECDWRAARLIVIGVVIGGVVKRIIYIAISLAMVAGLHFSGVLTSFTLTHPIWRSNATLYGSLGGAVLSVLVFWACASKPRLGRWLERGVIICFLITLPVTIYYAQVFIESADYEPMAVQIWHKGSYAVFITFVPALAVLLSKLRIIGSQAS